MTNNEDYSLEDEAALVAWAGNVGRVDRHRLLAWVASTLNAEPNSRAEKQRRYQLAEIFLVAFNRQLVKTPDDALLVGLTRKLEEIMAEGSGELDTTFTPYDRLEL